jgi:hypothetical protein
MRPVRSRFLIRLVAGALLRLAAGVTLPVLAGRSPYRALGKSSRGNAPMQLMRRLVPLGALCLCLVLASCEAISSTTSTSVTPAPTVITPHRDAAFAQYCADDTGSYPRADFFLANKLVASSLQQAVVANSDGLQLYATSITSTTFDPSNTLAPFTIPAIAAYPSLPTPLPTPPNDNPVSYSATATAVGNQNNAGITSYNAAVAQKDAEVKADQAQVANDAKRLAPGWNPKIDSNATSVWGCLQLARQRFATQTGTKYLIIASDMQNNSNVDYTSDFTTHQYLKGVIVDVIYYVCQNGAGACQNLQAQWTHTFTASGAKSVRFTDPAQSDALGNLLGGA